MMSFARLPEIVALEEGTIWQVECVVDDGAIEVARFSGPRAEERARAHAKAEYGVEAQPDF